MSQTLVWTITAEKDPRWNATGETTEEFNVCPEAFEHVRRCQAQFPFPDGFVKYTASCANYSYGTYIHEDDVRCRDELVARQRPVPPASAVPKMTVAEMHQVLVHDSLRQGATYGAALGRLAKLTENAPRMGYFETHDPAEALVLVAPMTEAEKSACISYLKAGGWGVGWMGYAACRICGQCLGTSCNLTPDGKWRYPARWEHYVEVHGCRPPSEKFIRDALAWVKVQGSPGATPE